MNDYAQIVDQLRKLHADAGRMLSGRNVTLQEARDLAGDVATVRMLLSAWLSAGSKHGLDAGILDKVKELRERYLELEGLVKEVRNNLETR